MRKIYPSVISILLIGIITLIGCTDDPLKVGLQILPAGDQLDAIEDTLAIKCLTSKISYPGYSTGLDNENDNCPIGYVNDSVFGKTWAQSIVAFTYGKFYETADPADEFVGAYLYLNINSEEKYGKGTSDSILVHPMKQSITFGTSASSPLTNYEIISDLYPFLDLPISNTASPIDIKAEDEIAKLDTGYYLKVKLNDDFGKSFLNVDVYKDATSFSNHFPGFYITGSSSNNGCLHNFYHKKSKFIIEYKRANAKTDGTDSTLFITHDIQNYQGFYRHNYSTSEISDQINGQIEKEEFYVQSLDGVKGYIELTDLEKFREQHPSNVGINLAELVIPASETHFADSGIYNFPERLTLKAASANDRINPIFEDDLFSARYFNGYYDRERKEYRLNITEYANRYLQGKTKVNKLYLMAAVNDFSKNSIIAYKKPGRVVLNSGMNEVTNRSYLRLIYTKTQF